MKSRSHNHSRWHHCNTPEGLRRRRAAADARREALALSTTDPAQAWFDAKTAEHEAMRAKQDAAVGAA